MQRRRLRLLVGLAVSVGSVAVSASPAVALTDEIAYGCDVDICLVQPDVPGVRSNATLVPSRDQTGSVGAPPLV